MFSQNNFTTVVDKASVVLMLINNKREEKIPCISVGYTNELYKFKIHETVI